MSTKASKQFIGATAVVLVALATIPLKAAADNTGCEDGKNLTGQCTPGVNVESNAISGVASTISNLSPSSCDKLLDSPTEKAFVDGLSKINQQYLSGSISIQQRGQQVIALANQIAAQVVKANGTVDTNQVQRALLGLGMQYSSDFAAALQRAIQAQMSTGGKTLTPAQSKELARVGVVINQTQTLKSNTAGNDPYYNAMKSAGITNNGKGSFSFQGMSGKYTADQLKQNPSLVAAITNFISADHASALLNPNRKTIVPLQNDVVLPPAANGKLVVVSAATYEQDVKNTLQNFDTAAKDFLSNSKASSTTTGSFLRQVNGGSQNGAARLVAQAHMDEAYKHLSALGFPGVDQIAQFRDQAQKIDQANVQAGMDKLHKVEGAVGFTIMMGAGASGLSFLAKAADAADAGEAMNDVRVTKQLFSSGARSKALLEGIAGSTEGAADLQRAIHDASDAMTLGNMAPMAVMPFGFSAVTSAVDVAIDRHAGQKGSLMCRFVNNMSNSAAQNIMMANFAWAAPVSVLAGGVTETLTGGKISAEAATATAEVAQRGFFDGQMVVGTVKASANCVNQALDHQGATAEKTCADALMNGAFLAAGHVQLGKTFEKVNEVSNAKADARNGNIPVDFHFVDRAGDHYTVVDKTADGKDVAAQGDDGHVYKISTEKLKTLLKDGRLTVASRADKLKIAQAQEAYAKLPAVELKGDGENTTVAANEPKAANADEQPAAKPAEVNTVKTVADTADTAKSQANDDAAAAPGAEDNAQKVGDLAKTDPKVAAMETKVVTATDSLTNNDPNWKKIPTSKKIMLKAVFDSLSKDDLERIDRKLSTSEGRQEYAKDVAKIGEECKVGEGFDGVGVSQRDDGRWDSNGTFMGILYAQNSPGLACQEY